jgi:hypothetical protein
MPLHLAFVAGGKRWGRVGAYYVKANLLLLGTLVVINPVLQLFIVEFYPVALTLMLRFWAKLQSVHKAEKTGMDFTNLSSPAVILKEPSS